MSNEPLEPWDHVQIARHPKRPHTLDYVRALCEEFVELRGDRHFADDAALVAGIARFDGQTVMLLGHQKGTNTKENLRHNFGSPHPEGYRKALRIMQQAEKFGFPLLSFIDTPGASPNMESEERGQGWAIAENLMAMADLKTPVIATVIGEGGSGGALAIGVADRLLMLEHSIYSVASPEASAAILWHDASKAPEAAKAMKITAADLLRLGVADEILPEAEGGAHLDAARTIADVGAAIRRHLNDLLKQPIPELLQQRYGKYRSIGLAQEAQSAVVAAAMEHER